MRLKRLETFGFKSFADRMTFDFEDGITAIIGPNGCGKSNVVDSIKWVIGEQSAKALRGQDMTDVIFNGCASRKGMSHCEVTLVMDQLQGLMGIDTDEVGITRRLFRDGVSQYFLNGKPCRLKDIKELFLGTGMGSTSAYSVIEQGRIGFILESNVKERRLILEEAAGISKYKARRKIALRKMERVQTDVQRIGEVLAEVKRRARAIARQAAAALRYRELTSQAKDLRMAFALEEHGRLTSELTAHVARLIELEGAGAAAAARLAQLEAVITEAEVRLVGIETEVRGLEQQRADAQSRRDVAAHRGEDATARLAELDQQETDDRAGLTDIEAKLAALSVEHAAAEEGLNAIRDDGGDTGMTGEMAAKRGELDRMLDDVSQLVRRIEDVKAKKIECLRELSRIDAETGRLGSSRSATEDRRRRMEERSGGQTGQLVQALAAEQTARAQVEATMFAAVQAHSSLDTLITDREGALNEANRLDQELAELRHHETRADTTLRLLQEQERRAEGVYKGVKDVLQEQDRFPGVIGMVADLFRVGDQHVTAIEVALGQQAQNLVTETQEAAKNAIEFLKRERRGRATFLPLDDIRGDERIDPQLMRESGVVDVASRLVDFEPRLRPVFEFLLGNVLVVETLDHGIAIRRRHRVRCRMVTLDGEVITAGGAMTGGRSNAHEGGGVVSRKAEILRLEDTVAGAKAQREAAASRRDAARTRADALGRQAEETRRAIHASDRTAAEAKAALMGAERDRLHLQENTSSFGAELEEIASELSRLEAEARDLAGQREWFGALDRKLGGDLEAMQHELDGRAAARDRAQEAVNSLRVEAATSAERREAARNQVHLLVRQMQELEDRQARLRERLDSLDLKRTELRRIQTEAARTHTADAAETSALAERLDVIIKERDQLRDAHEGRRQEARRLNSETRRIEQERSGLELKANEARVRLENLAQRTLDDYQVILAEAFLNYVRPPDLDWEALKKQLETVETELAGLGPVNLAAIDELEEVQARETFLDKQFADLNDAADKLGEIIAQLNETSRVLFETTYKEVRKNFQELFRMLFGGGRADLKLEETDENGQAVDMLEAGMEIIASPPGKNPKIITQLSGGEKALTAIALLFAVYRTKPSPFCILDEVDAPLDEANVDVYNTMLRQFTTGGTHAGSAERGSQFIVITHKKRTMQRSDAIYGITQNEPGVSTKISVKFEDVESLGDELAATVRGAGPFAK